LSHCSVDNIYAGLVRITTAEAIHSPSIINLLHNIIHLPDFTHISLIPIALIILTRIIASRLINYVRINHYVRLLSYTIIRFPHFMASLI
jgi:hypothetical protein